MKKHAKHAPYPAWFLSMAAVVISLYFSEVLKFAPCVLCWYQRILMYPLALIIPIGILYKDMKMYRYVIPFSTLGMIVSAYHYLLYVGFIPEVFSPCTTGVSCLTKYIEWLGFINIPLLSFISFTLITLLMLIYRKHNGAQ